MSETIDAPAPARAAHVIDVPPPAPVSSPAPVAAVPEASPAPTLEAPLPSDPAPAQAPTPAPVQAPQSTLLGGPDKPVEQPAPGDANAPEGQSVEPAPPPTYEPFTLPEGVTLSQPERLEAYTSTLGKFGISQEGGQELISMHLAEITQRENAIRTEHANAETAREQEWRQQTQQDPEIGGNRLQTTLDSVHQFIRTHGGNAAEQAEALKVLNETKVGSNPTILRLLSRAGSTMSEGKPLAAAAPPSLPKSNTQKLYGGNGR